MTEWTSKELSNIGSAEEIRIAGLKADGSLRRSVIIWVVRVGNDLYVRSANGRSSGPRSGSRETASRNGVIVSATIDGCETRTVSVRTSSGEGAGALSIVQQSIGPDAQQGSTEQNASAELAGIIATTAIASRIAVIHFLTVKGTMEPF